MNEFSGLTLSTGAKIPSIGLGTWRAQPGEVGQAVEYAILEAGYRHIDCAYIYRNEKEIGLAFSKVFGSGKVAREEVFITSKLWNTAHAKNNVVQACKNTLHDLQLDYLDLYLVHWGLAVPAGVETEPVDKNGFMILDTVPMQETWEAMEELVQMGLVKAIGVANFTAPMLIDLFSYAKIVPAVNQIELHPYNTQKALVEFCQYKNIVVTAYSPLGSPGNIKDSGKPVLLKDEKVVMLAEKYHKSTAQILLRWAIQRGTIVIPKSIHPENIKNNMAVFDFELSVEEMDTISALDKKLRYINPFAWWKVPYFE